MKKLQGVIGMGDYLTALAPKHNFCCKTPHHMCFAWLWLIIQTQIQFQLQGVYDWTFFSCFYCAYVWFCICLNSISLSLLVDVNYTVGLSHGAFFPRLRETWWFQLKRVVGLLEPKVMLMLLTCHFADSRRGTSSTCTSMSMLWWCQGSEACGSHASGAAWMIQKNRNRKHRRFWPASGL